MSTKKLLEKLNESFGSYRAEWLKSQIFDLFAEPYYFSVLQDNRPCVLEGGRGTGKTTVLRGLSYQGQYAIQKDDIADFDKSKFIGIYHRVNTNHVRAFTGGNIAIKEWERVFAHYFNLLICREILIFIKWHSAKNREDIGLTPHSCRLIAMAMNIQEKCGNSDELLEMVDMAMYTFQSEINSIIDGNLPKLSLAGEPIKLITEHVISLPQFAGKMFFILLDEYENYEDYQQQIINSLLKHSPESYTFKIGVRELGWRIKHTLNTSELLHDPADYVLINIERHLTTHDSTFSEFAKNVCQQRIRKLLPEDTSASPIYEIEYFLKGLSIEEEAELLDVNNTSYVKEYDILPKVITKKIAQLHPLYKFFIAYWAAIHKLDLRGCVEDYLQNTNSWNTRYENYKYEMLFKIRRGRGKAGIQKYYAGWQTYTKLANGNIRYLMELVYRAYEKHLMAEQGLEVPVSPKNQTLGAQEAGLKNLMELEGLWKNGAQLTKLLLGVGRIFQIMANSDSKSAPERNQFTIERTDENLDEFEELIRAAVMHLALIRTPGNKMEDNDTRDYIYMIHPLYSAYFQFSHRKKRKIKLSSIDIMGVINNPKEVIKNILDRSNISQNAIINLPQQMSLFEAYYNEK